MAIRRHGPTPGYRPGQRIGLPVVPLPPEWTRQARCTPEQADRLFYADVDQDEADPSTFEARQTEARAICASCPVRAACDREAAAVDRLHGHHGIWAGRAADDRAPRRALSARKCSEHTEPRRPVPRLSKVDFDNDVMRFADQGATNAEIADYLGRTLCEVRLARERAGARRWRASRRLDRLRGGDPARLIGDGEAA